ncbi:MAG: CHAT domain-containing protein [Candidatus Eisenbacteria bacterium]|nr:CHAT domain-containing protein [Candidatus Eisenbacteria bacterium]
MIDPRTSSADEVARFLRDAPHSVSADVASSIRDWVAQRVLSDPQRALEIARSLRDVVNQSADAGAMAHGWRCFGDASLYQGRFHEAREAYDQARDHARAAGAGGLLGQILVAQIGVLSTQGRADAAAALVPEAEKLLESAGDRPYLARLHMNLGNAAYHRHQYQEAYEHFSRADREFSALGATDGMTLGLRINLGVVSYSALSKVEDARRIFLSVEEDCARLGLHHLEAQAKFNRAHLESLWGNYREAISLLESAEAAFAEEDAPELMAGTQLTRAEAFVDLGMPDEAIDLAYKAGETYRSCELELDAAVADEVRARALRSEGRTTEARRLLDRVRDFYEGSELPVGVALTDLEIARMMRTYAELLEAEDRATRSLQVLEAQGLVEPRGRGEIVLAETFRRMGTYDRAEDVVAGAIERVSQLNTRTRIDLWTVAGRVARDAGQRFVALRRYRRAVAEVEKDRHLTPGAELKARAAGTDADRELIDLLVCGDRLKVGNLFRLVETVQGRRWREDEARRTGTAEWSRRRAELASLVRQVQKRELESIQSGLPLDVAELSGIREQIATLESEILSGVRTAFFRPGGESSTSSAVASGSSQLRQGPSSRELQRSVSPNQAVIEYFFTGDRIVALVLRSNASHFEVLDVQPDSIQAKLRQWNMGLESFALLAHRGVPNLDFHRRAADHLLERLATALLSPLLGRLDGVEELVVVPHAYLHRVPFECLRIEGEYLDQRFRVRRLPSAGLLRRESAPSGSHRDVVLVAVQNGPPGAEPEGRAISEQHGAELLLDPTSEEVLGALENARTVHWTTHGVLRDDNPLFSHLATRDGGFFLADLRGRRLGAQRIVLSACETGAVVSGRSDDVAGVALAFLESGTRELVAGLWRLHDQATVDYMTRFYQELGDDTVDTAEALQRANRSMRASWDHPFYWGGIALYG